MALLSSQITLINALVDATTLTETQGRDLLSTQDGFTATQITLIQSLGLTSAQESLLLESTNLSQGQLEQEIESAKEALVAGNYNEARKQLLLAEMTLAGLSNYELGNRKVEYREGIRYIANRIDQYEAKASTNTTKNKRVFANYIRE